MGTSTGVVPVQMFVGLQLASNRSGLQGMVQVRGASLSSGRAEEWGSLPVVRTWVDRARGMHGPVSQQSPVPVSQASNQSGDGAEKHELFRCFQQLC